MTMPATTTTATTTPTIAPLEEPPPVDATGVGPTRL